jgi:hypothetical protein
MHNVFIYDFRNRREPFHFYTSYLCSVSNKTTNSQTFDKKTSNTKPVPACLDPSERRIQSRSVGKENNAVVVFHAKMKNSVQRNKI